MMMSDATFQSFPTLIHLMIIRNGSGPKRDIGEVTGRLELFKGGWGGENPRSGGVRHTIASCVAHRAGRASG